MKKYPNRLRSAPRLLAATFCSAILFFSSLGVVTNTHAIAVTTPLPTVVVPPCTPTAIFPCTPVAISTVTSTVIATATATPTPTPTDTPTDTPTPTHHKKKATPTPTPYIPPAYIPPYLPPTSTPTPTPTDTPMPTDTPTDTPTPTPSVVPVVAHSSAPPTTQSGNKSPIVPIFIGLGVVASLSVLVVIGVMLRRRNLSPTPGTNLPPSGAPAWNRWGGDGSQGNTLITGTPLGNNAPFPPMNPGSAPTYQGPFNDPFPPNPGNGPQLPFPPANDWFGPPNQP